jgi:hypothetical protein
MSCTYCTYTLHSVRYASGINARVRISGISKVELSLEELELVLQTLVYDGRLEEVTSFVFLGTYEEHF